MFQKLRTGIFASIAMLVLILDTKTAISGAQDAITLCISTVIPSLLPFFILSSLLTVSLTGVSFRCLRPVEKLCRISRGCGILPVIGLLGGYPTGAQCVSEAYRRGQISEENAKRMLAFCNNAGPAFIFGILGSRFHAPWAPWAIWGVHILSCLLVGTFMPGDHSEGTVTLSEKNPNWMDCVERSGGTMAKVCLWIIVFRVIIAFLERWFLWLFPTEIGVLLRGALELTIGCTGLSEISKEGVRFVICCGMLAFGGLCVTMQTAAVTGSLGIGSCVKGKLLQSFLSVILAYPLQNSLYPDSEKLAFSGAYIVIGIILGGMIVLILLKSKKSVALSSQLMYNSQQKGGENYAVSKKDRKILQLLQTRRKVG